MSRKMPRAAKGILGIISASLALGAVHLEIAAGSDLKAGAPGDASLSGTAPYVQLASHDVNRATKADRLGSPSPGNSGPTLVFKVAGLDNVSVATFMPLARRESARQESNSARSKDGSRAIMNTAACEPPVSALTELAKKIETGRCVT